jgi:chromosome segregation ATPase
LNRPTSALESPDSYKEQIVVEQKRAEEYGRHIRIIQEKIKSQRQQMGGINASKDTASALNKQLRILENRLDKANQKFNEAIANNKKLREQIDNLRRERVIFDSIYQKLEKELHDKRKEMANIIEAANSAYEDRDRAQEQLGTLKIQAKKEQDEFEREWKELNTLIEKNKKMKEFMRLKQQERQQEDAANANPLEEDTTRKRKGVPSPSQTIGDRIRLYEEAFNKIQAATGITDIEELVQTFIKAEDQNFTLFKFVNELSNDIETLEAIIQDLKEETQSYRGKEPGSNAQRQKIVRTLQDRLEKFKELTVTYQRKYEASQRTVNELKTTVESLFRTIECDRDYAAESIGAEVTESNMHQYLGLIEQQATEVLQTYAVLQAQSGRGDFAPQHSLPAMSPMKVEVPNMMRDEFSDEEAEERTDDDRPLTADELRSRAEKLVQSMKFIPNRGKSKSKGKKK